MARAESGRNSQPKNTADLTWKIYQIMQSNYDYMLNTFKLILSGSVPEPEGEYLKFCMQRELGPPGGEAVAESLQKEVGGTLTEENLKWGVMCIFSTTVHWALMSGTEYVKRMPSCGEQFQSDIMETTVKDHTSAIVRHLKSL